jgi:hypothetical protein
MIVGLVLIIGKRSGICHPADSLGYALWLLNRSLCGLRGRLPCV